MYFQSDDKQLRDIHKRFGSNKLKDFPTTSIIAKSIIDDEINSFKSKFIIQI